MTDFIMTAEKFAFEDEMEDYVAYIKGIDFCCEHMSNDFFDKKLNIKGTSMNMYPNIRMENDKFMSFCPYCGSKIRVVTKNRDEQKISLEIVKELINIGLSNNVFKYKVNAEYIYYLINNKGS